MAFPGASLVLAREQQHESHARERLSSRCAAGQRRALWRGRRGTRRRGRRRGRCRSCDHAKPGRRLRQANAEICGALRLLCVAERDKVALTRGYATAGASGGRGQVERRNRLVLIKERRDAVADGVRDVVSVKVCVAAASLCLALRRPVALVAKGDAISSTEIRSAPSRRDRDESQHN